MGGAGVLLGESDLGFVSPNASKLLMLGLTGNRPPPPPPPPPFDRVGRGVSTLLSLDAMLTDVERLE